jgi:hypothetical protein
MKKVLAVLLALLLSGCAYSTVLQPTWPSLTRSGLQLRFAMADYGPLEIPNGDKIETTKCIIVINNTTSSGITRVGEPKMWTDLKVWGSAIADQLNVGLEKRGVKIGATNAIIFKIIVTSVQANGGYGYPDRVNISVRVEKDGWVKMYKDSCDLHTKAGRKAHAEKVKRYLPKGRAIKVDQLYDITPAWVLVFIVDKILNDPDFRNALK